MHSCAIKTVPGDYVEKHDLAESERRLRTIIATEPECMKVVGADGRLLEMNPAGLAMLEAGSLAEAQARPLLDFLLPEYRDAFAALHQRVVRGESGTLEFEVIGLKGGRRWLETHAAPLPGANGEAAMLLGITRDVTARKLAERRLRESEERFCSLTKLSSDWYWEQDASFRFTVMSGGLVNKGNLAVSKALGKTRWELPIELSASEWAAHRATLEAHRVFTDFEYKIATDDGSMRYYSARGEPFFDDQGRFEGYRGTTNDITERKLVERELQQFRMAMDVSTDSISLTDPATLRFVYMNNAVCEQLGYTREQLLQMGPHDVLSVDRAQISREFDEVVAAGEGGLSKEHRFVTSSGGEGWTELHRRALRAGEGTLIVTIGRDITERKRADDKIRRLNRVYAVLSSINSLIVRVRGREELFKEACQIAVEEGGLRMAWIGIVDRKKMELVPVAAAGTTRDSRELINQRFSLRKDAPLGNALSARAIREKRAFFPTTCKTTPMSCSRANTRRADPARWQFSHCRFLTRP